MKKKENAPGGDLRRKGQIQEAWDRLKKQPVAVLCMIVIALLFLIAIFADVIADYDTLCVAQNLGNKLKGPSA